MSDATPIDSLNETVSHALLFNKKPLPITFEIYSISVHKEINKISRAVIKILGGNPKLNLFEEARTKNKNNGLKRFGVNDRFQPSNNSIDSRKNNNSYSSIPKGNSQQFRYHNTSGINGNGYFGQDIGQQ